MNFSMLIQQLDLVTNDELMRASIKTVLEFIAVVAAIDLLIILIGKAIKKKNKGKKKNVNSKKWMEFRLWKLFMFSYKWCGICC